MAREGFCSKVTNGKGSFPGANKPCMTSKSSMTNNELLSILGIENKGEERNVLGRKRAFYNDIFIYDNTRYGVTVLVHISGYVWKYFALLGLLGLRIALVFLHDLKSNTPDWVPRPLAVFRPLATHEPEWAPVPEAHEIKMHDREVQAESILKRQPAVAKVTFYEHVWFENHAATALGAPKIAFSSLVFG